MKHARWIQVLAPLLVLAFTATAFAAGSGHVTLSSAAQLNGKALTAGSYKVEWDSHTPKTDVTFLRGRHEVVTAQAKLVERPHSARFNTVETKKGPNGSSTLVEVRFRGRRSALVFD